MFPSTATAIRDAVPATVIQGGVRGCAARRFVQGLVDASVLHRHPIPRKADKIVEHLGLNENGEISLTETKELFVRVVRQMP